MQGSEPRSEICGIAKVEQCRKDPLDQGTVGIREKAVQKEMLQRLYVGTVGTHGASDSHLQRLAIVACPWVRCSKERPQRVRGCAATAAMTVRVASNPGMVGASLRSEVQHCYKLRSRVPPPPNAFMQFTQEKRRSVAATNANEDNWRVSSRLAKLWRPRRAADKKPFQRKVAEAVAVH
ncbi:hypothetical protein HPB49_020002 [Dermacentor silvarum]|uniref:Uncharacterized protein n=1 Tax=Dermacentor silvarum TaxID=543639 RepID=A0ACB8E2A2_DERSI|nr:hypothetical protein HPB49_020002 [Dermacentor silvarum]